MELDHLVLYQRHGSIAASEAEGTDEKTEKAVNRSYVASFLCIILGSITVIFGLFLPVQCQDDTQGTQIRISTMALTL